MTLFEIWKIYFIERSMEIRPEYRLKTDELTRAQKYYISFLLFGISFLIIGVGSKTVHWGLAIGGGIQATYFIYFLGTDKIDPICRRFLSKDK